MPPPLSDELERELASRRLSERAMERERERGRVLPAPAPAPRDRLESLRRTREPLFDSAA